MKGSDSKERQEYSTMNITSTADNRRKEARVAIDENVYVVIDTKPQMMGQMVEISSRGMAFTFVDLDAVSQRLKDQADLRLDLFAGGKGYFIRNLPCRVVSKIDEDHSNSMASVLIKRVGVEFESLTLPQQVQINALIRRHNKRAQQA